MQRGDIISTTVQGRNTHCYLPVGGAECLLLLIDGKKEVLFGLVQQITAAYGRCPAAIVTVQPSDWFEEFSPWPAPALFAGQAPFGGMGDRYLDDVLCHILPHICQQYNLQLPVCRRGVIGYSRGGLMAVYTWLGRGGFGGFASCSGSMWYPNFLSWMQGKAPAVKNGFGYLSLGDREQIKKIPAFANVNDCAAAATQYLQQCCPTGQVVFAWNPGDHGDQVIQRLGKGAVYLVQKMMECNN